MIAGNERVGPYRTKRKFTRYSFPYDLTLGFYDAGNNELDQIQKIHKILGTPPVALLEKMKRQKSSTLATAWALAGC